MAEIDGTWKYTYRDNIEAELAQFDSRFRSAVTEIACMGEGMRPVMRMGTTDAEEIITRGETVTEKEIEITERWIEPRDWDVGPFREYDLDKVRNGISVTGDYVRRAAEAYRRKIDDLVIVSATATAKTGKHGSGTANFDTSNMRVSSGSQGMTVAKLRENLTNFRQQEIDLDQEPLYCAISALQLDNLLADIQVTNADYNGELAPLREGKLAGFMGHRFILSERLATTGGERRCLTCVPKGLCLGVWKEWETDIGINMNIRGYPIQSYAKFKLSATRLDEKRVGEILCAES